MMTITNLKIQKILEKFTTIPITKENDDGEVIIIETDYNLILRYLKKLGYYKEKLPSIENLSSHKIMINLRELDYLVEIKTKYQCGDIVVMSAERENEFFIPVGIIVDEYQICFICKNNNKIAIRCFASTRNEKELLTTFRLKDLMPVPKTKAK